MASINETKRENPSLPLNNVLSSKSWGTSKKRNSTFKDERFANAYGGKRKGVSLVNTLKPWRFTSGFRLGEEYCPTFYT